MDPHRTSVRLTHEIGTLVLVEVHYQNGAVSYIATNKILTNLADLSIFKAALVEFVD